MFKEYRHLTRRIDSDIYYPAGTLCLKVHRNGELTLSENTVYPLRIPGYESLNKKLKKLADDSDERILEGFSLAFLRDKYKHFKFSVNELEKISLASTREMLERYAMKLDGARYLASAEREEVKKWTLEKNRDKNLRDSMQRSKKSLIDYAFNNQWTYFATFTVNSELCDRNSLAACNKKIGMMLNQFRRYFCEGFKYLIVPEQHKDGAFHYHGMVYFPQDPEFTDVRVKGKIVRTIDYFTQFLGFNSFSKILNQVRAAKYITKYIDKQMNQGHIRNIREQIADAKLLLHSRGLRRGLKLYFRKDALPEAIHLPAADPETGEVSFSVQVWGACRTEKDISKLCTSIATEYSFDGHEIFGYILGSISRLRQNNYFDIKI